MAIRKQKKKPISRRVSLDAPLFTEKAAPQYIVPDYNVFDAALDRIRWLFDEFDGKIQVSNSGGKDSTVVLELAARVAREKDMLPLRVMWLDQECEYQATVDYQRYLMYERDDIDFRWYQVPFKLENASNLTNRYLNVWGEGEEWVREKEPGSIHENVYGEFGNFNKLLDAINRRDFQGALLDGMRMEESPSRRLLMMTRPQFKYATWSVGPAYDVQPHEYKTRGVWRFQPIYDWSYRDVWKAIYENDWRYNTYYDEMFKRKVPINKMRVSNYHHEQALQSLMWLQEIEPETWEAATKRLEGISSFGHLGTDQYPTELPYMFVSWREYMEYLIEKLPPTEELRQIFRDQFDRITRATGDFVDEDTRANTIIIAILKGDYFGVTVQNFLVKNRPPKTTTKEASA